ncbi:MAG: hypothetical protein LBO74_13140 [Candidatus Symbiothrix sp.]|jgi:hypothetical protein|nr:hypothetical protein [Candidatus Symbiothrix sp.]
MKTKKFIIAIVCLLATCQFAVADMKENTESWLSKSSAGSGGDSRIGLTDTPTDAPTVEAEPIPDSLPYILLLSGIYFCLVKRKEEKTV